MKLSFWYWYPRAENANVVFQEVYAPLIKALAEKPVSRLAEELENLIVRDFFDLWSAKRLLAVGPPKIPFVMRRGD
jgi:hypothetical protein